MKGAPENMAFPGGVSDIEAAWLGCARSMGRAAARAVSPLTGTASGRHVVGRGQGGDDTVELDEAAERAMIETAEACAPAAFRVVSEERGAGGDEEAEWTVLIDPVDGSLNAKRGIPVFSAVVAVALGRSIGDVRVAYTVDLVSLAEYAAIAGGGVSFTRRVERNESDATVEAIMLEAGPPERQRFRFCDLAALAPRSTAAGVRVRQIGSLALALSHVASGAADVLLSPVPSRAVDIAAGVVMVRESGGGAAALDDANIWKQPLDLARRSPFVAWRAGVDGADVIAGARSVLGL